MKTRIFTLGLTVLLFGIGTFAQSDSAAKKAADKVKDASQPKIYKANPDDVKSIDSILKAVYNVISGDLGVKRNWDRMRSLFHKEGRLMPTGTNPNTGITGTVAITLDDYIKRSGPYLVKNGFHEVEVARKVERFGNIAHVFSTYEARNKLSDEKPFMRGINSFQLLNDGTRWWVISIYWQQEGKDNPIPAKYLKN